MSCWAWPGRVTIISYQPIGESAENLALMLRIDKLFTDRPELGVRRMQQELTTLGAPLHTRRFACWLGLVSNNKVSGGKVISNRRPSVRNTIAKALRHAANLIGNQKDHELTPFFKRIAFKKGRIAPIIATARKLAVIIWNMISKEEAYQKERVESNQEKQHSLKLKHLDKKLHAFQLTQEELKKLFIKHSLSAD